MMPGFGTNSAMSSASLPSRVEYNTSNNSPSEYIYDQGVSYPATNGYAYYTGFEPPVNWSEHSNFWGADGQNLKLSTGNLPYVYCTPGYGFSYSSPDQYTYMPGMFLGVDDSFVASQQYFASQYQPAGLPSGYFPMFIQPTADLSSTVSLDSPIFSTCTSIASRPANTSRNKHEMSGNTTPVSQAVSSGSPAIGLSQHAYQNQSTNKPSDLPGADVTRCDKPSTSQLTIPFDASSTDKNFQVTSGAWSSGDRGSDKVSPVATTAGEDTQTKAVSSSSLENIVIHPDQYNKDDFPFDYPDAKFFVIKSYSEDDIHKSVKYNVWSSTPNGNRRLDAAYSDAQKRTPRKCIFLFFSVNTSGQFCGVAEMVGPVAFHKDMYFWQQDKWSGSFPVKWHLVKDAANSTFRHIILENNENKPVTNSRDTQEIPYKSGIQMLKLFKNSPMMTSILDDFPFYEGRQKAMIEQKRRHLGRSFDGLTYDPAFVARSSFDVVGDPSELGKGACSSKGTNSAKTGHYIGSKGTNSGKTGHYIGACEQPGKTSQMEDGVVIQVPKRDGITLFEQPEYVKSDRHSLDARVNQQNENCSGSATASPENVEREPAGCSKLVKLNGKGYNGRKVQPQISSSESNCSSGRKGLPRESGGHDPSDFMKYDASMMAEDIKSIKLLKKPEGLSTSQVDRQAKDIFNEMTGITPAGVVKVGSVCIKVNVAGESSSEILGDGMGSFEPKGAEHSEQAMLTKVS